MASGERVVDRRETTNQASGSDHREGQWVYYRLHPELEGWQSEVLTVTLNGLGARAPYREDMQRLQALERNKQTGDCR